jgi:hypothetical protein
MSCFNHSDKVSVGGCKNCGRGLCRDCIASDLDSIACKNRCEEKVKAIDAFMQKAVLTKYNTTSTAYFIVTVLLMTLSVMLYRTPDLETYGILIGLLSLLLFGNTIRSMRRR